MAFGDYFASKTSYLINGKIVARQTLPSIRWSECAVNSLISAAAVNPIQITFIASLLIFLLCLIQVNINSYPYPYLNIWQASSPPSTNSALTESNRCSSFSYYISLLVISEVDFHMLSISLSSPLRTRTNLERNELWHEEIIRERSSAEITWIGRGRSVEREVRRSLMKLSECMSLFAVWRGSISIMF